MLNDLLKSLNESVKKRRNTSDRSVSIYHKSKPLGKLVTKPKMVDGKPDYSINRGRIGNTKKITYKYTPQIKTTRFGKESVIPEEGKHTYHFDTNSGKKVRVEIKHMPTTKRADMLKGILGKSRVTFSVDGDYIARQGKESDGLEIMRGVITSLRHHTKSHNPDQISFSGGSTDDRDRAKLYRYLLDRFAKNKYHVSEINNSEFSNRFILNKRKKLDPSILGAMKRIDRMREKIKKGK